MIWQWFSFDELTPERLYNLLALRTEIFVVEQDCVYQDMDGKDKKSLHLTGEENDVVLATARLLPPGLSYECCAIGRVAVSAAARGRGTGRKLMDHMIEKAREIYPGVPIKLSGQAYLRDFYQSLGFRQMGASYLEDGIPHFAMMLD